MKKIVNSVIWLFVTIGLLLCVLLYYAWSIRQRMEITIEAARKDAANARLLHNYLEKTQYYTNYSFWFILMAVAVAIIFLAVEGRYIALHFRQLRDRANRLYKNTQSYKRLAQQAGPIMYTSSPEGFFTYVNEGVATITGYQPEQVIGKHYSMFLDTRTYNKLQDYYVSQMKGYLDYSSIQFEIITSSGEKKWVEQMVSIIRDDEGRVTEFQCIVKELYHSNGRDYRVDYLRDRLEAVVDFTPSMMFIKDMEGRYILVNQRFTDVMQVKKEEVIGRIDADLQYPWASRYAELDSAVISTGTAASLDDTLELNGEQVHYYVTKFPLRNAHDEMIGVCGIAHDVTEKKNHIKALVQAQRIAEEARRAQETFLANMSHEIRTPMNGILGMTQLLRQDTKLSTQQQEFVSAIQTSAANLLVIINEILDFSKIKAGKLKIEETPFHLRDEVEKAMYPLRIQIQEKKLAFNVLIDERIPQILIGDKIRLMQVLVNLVENAIKFTARGSVSVHLYPLAITPDTLQLRIEVTDTGIGIAPEKQQFVFESFTQSHSANNRNFGGTGLGLAICKELVEMQGGEIRVISELGKGAMFTVELPFRYDDNISPEGEKLTRQQLNSKHLLGKSILVVEDNLINQKVAFHALQKGGARVHMVENGQIAVELTLLQSYDCILMDIQMPGMDGYEATRTIRKNGINTVIIAMTASALKGEKERCLEAGMNAYISKPYEQQELFSTILKSTGTSMPAPQQLFTMTNTPYNSPDSNYLREKVGLDDQEIILLYQDMLLEFPAKMEVLQQHVQQQDWENTFIMAHQIKTLFKLLQYNAAADLCESIEIDANRSENLVTIPARVSSLITAYNAFLPSLQAAANQPLGNEK
ncbi:PAS domain-containing hybrid sensor histidine kinase/response regulator [Chitinophaga sp. sic0106]|uniref:PAS domain-containing hybrid sensor histidine kinase/response regulator n=1 Tax=Chitinophaga sp. sic0106 TaxID=2854785 RepID=UPI001C47E654|nr:ATP-binding protein [Chitinophaga sp. sic0106]MBV7528543.1 response regulator [Chitinophaga sp. sic0106]